MVCSLPSHLRQCLLLAFLAAGLTQHAQAYTNPPALHVLDIDKAGWPEQKQICGALAERINQRASKAEPNIDKDDKQFPQANWRLYIAPEDKPPYYLKTYALIVTGQEGGRMQFHVQDNGIYRLGEGSAGYFLMRHNWGAIYPHNDGDDIFVAPGDENPKAVYANFATGQMICGGEKDEPDAGSACRSAIKLPVHEALEKFNKDFTAQNNPNPLPSATTDAPKRWMPEDGMMVWVEPVPANLKITPQPFALLAISSYTFWEDSPDDPSYLTQNIPGRIMFMQVIRSTDKDDEGTNREFELKPVNSCLLEQSR